ncbi:MAG: ABC transporter permease [Clostridiales bacterium]|nr:ABC transporter permease [Clostridiales bacterium]
MAQYIWKRILMMIPVMLGVTFVIFFILELTPGDPAAQILGGEATQEQILALREEMGLNDPFLVRYVSYIWDLLHGDMGISYTTKQPVAVELMERFPTTLLLSFLCCVVGAVIGIVLGIISAVKQYTIFDNVARVLALAGISIPSFWLGLMFIVFFSVRLGWFPSSGFYGPSYWVLPSLTVGLVQASTVMRQTRSAMLEVIRQDYIRTARAKGQSELNVIVGHALPNALITIVTVIGIQFGHGLGGAIISEQVFSIPGIGKLMVDAIGNRNYPVVQGGVLLIALSFSIVNLLVDILYAFIDPRIQTAYGSGRKRRKRAERKAVV